MFIVYYYIGNGEFGRLYFAYLEDAILELICRLKENKIAYLMEVEQ